MDSDTLKTIIYIVIAVIWFLGSSLGKKKKKKQKHHRPSPSRRSRTLEELESPSRRSGHTIVMRNIHHYREHPVLIRTVARYSGWDDKRVQAFLNQNTVLKIHDQPPYESVSIIADLNKANIPVASFNRGSDQDVIVLKVRTQKPVLQTAAPSPTETRSAPSQAQEKAPDRSDSRQEESLSERRKREAYQEKLQEILRQEAVQKKASSKSSKAKYSTIKETEIGSPGEGGRLLNFDRHEVLRGIIYSEILSSEKIYD